MDRLITNEEVDYIYNMVDDLCHKAKWEVLNTLLETVIFGLDLELNNHSEIILQYMKEVDYPLSWLTATLPAKSHLPSRVKLLKMCRERWPDEDLWKGLD